MRKRIFMLGRKHLKNPFRFRDVTLSICAADEIVKALHAQITLAHRLDAGAGDVLLTAFEKMYPAAHRAYNLDEPCKVRLCRIQIRAIANLFQERYTK